MEVNELLKLNEEEIFELLGSKLRRTRSSPAESAKGRGWFRKNRKKLIELVCPKYEILKNKKESEAALEIVAIISDSFLGIPALIIAVIILKTGLNKLCEVQVK